MKESKEIEETIARTDLARQVGIHPATLRRMEVQGVLDPIRINARHIRYRLKEVKEVFAPQMKS